MQNNNQTKEIEFRYVISLEMVGKKVPKHIAGFSLKKAHTIDVTDVLFERTSIPLKDENIGIRVRKYDSNYEFTYKKFLGMENGAAKFDEQTIKITESIYQDFTNTNLSHIKFPILEELQTVGELFILVTISNRREVYLFEHTDSELELVVENLTYKSGEKKAHDAMIEIEIKKSTDDDLEKINEFVPILKDFFGGTNTQDGKNSRAMKLLKLG